MRAMPPTQFAIRHLSTVRLLSTGMASRACFCGGQRARTPVTGDDPFHAALRVRAERQRAMLRRDPDLGAAGVMRLAAGDPDHALEAAGRRRDEYGFGRFGRIPNGG